MINAGASKEFGLEEPISSALFVPIAVEKNLNGKEGGTLYTFRTM